MTTLTMISPATSLNILAQIASEELALEQKQQAPPKEISFPTPPSRITFVGSGGRLNHSSASSFRRVSTNMSTAPKVRDESLTCQTSPIAYLEGIFARHGINLTRRKFCHGKRPPQSTLAKQQQQERPNIPSPTFEEVDAYDIETAQAVRNGDLSKLQELHRHKGYSLSASNRFGESLLHMCCRRGDANMVRFMVEEAKVNPRVVDDLGRTAFHDACWSVHPNPETMDVLLQALPPIGLLMQDSRGHSPFDYAPKKHWPVWVQYLQDREHVFVNWILARKQRAVMQQQHQQRAPQQQQMQSTRGSKMPTLVPNDSEDEGNSDAGMPLSREMKSPRAA